MQQRRRPPGAVREEHRSLSRLAGFSHGDASAAGGRADGPTESRLRQCRPAGAGGGRGRCGAGRRPLAAGAGEDAIALL